MDAMRRRGPSPVRLWRIINNLADARTPDSRPQRRCWRLRYWGAVRELVRVRLLFRHGPFVATQDFALTPRSRSQRRHRVASAVDPSNAETAGSIDTVPTAQTVLNTVQLPHAQLAVARPSVANGSSITENADTPAERSAAARSLASLPRKPKRVWTGYIVGARCWRDRLVLLPTGDVRPLVVVNRGRVVVRDDRDLPPRDWLRATCWYADDVRLHRDWAAQCLGRGKAGIRERPSPGKQATCRTNGCRPVRAGHRPRGRPSKLAGHAGPSYTAP
jgi:hypothetical protein